MCQSPTKLENGDLVACRYCWQCSARKVDDWVGRNVAESLTSTAAHVVTLTYGADLSTGGMDHLRASVLTYSDVQKFMKKLRRNGHPARYFVVGEYGSKKGRAHWHIVIYWKGEVPKVRLRANIHFPEWEHGFAMFDKMTPEAIRYACKYITKDTMDDARQGYGPMMSKKPPLGHDFFEALARRYVDAGLSPQDFFYSFPNVRRLPPGSAAGTRAQARSAAKPIKFLMSGKTRENFAAAFISQWEERYPETPWPKSQALYDLDKRSDPMWMLPPSANAPTPSSYFDAASGLYWRLTETGQKQWGEIQGLKGIVWYGEEEKTEPVKYTSARAAAEDEWYFDPDEIFWEDFGGI